MKVAESLGGEKMAALGNMLSGVKQEEVGMWGTRGKAREGNWRKMSPAGVGLACLHQTQLMPGEQLQHSGTSGLEGQLGRKGEGERRYSRTETLAPKRDCLTADVHGCFPPSGRFPEINLLSPPPLIPLSSSPPVPPCCHQVVQWAHGGSWCCASSETDRGSA